MPHFPGMGYPLVPGYESVGRVVDAGADARHRIGETVFVPGSTNYVGVRGLFGGSARTLVVPSARVTTIAQNDNSQSVLLALAATAFHAMRTARAPIDLVVGHGALGRLLARIIIASGHPAPTVWETNVARHSGSCGYDVTTPADDPRKDYRSICDVSGSATILDDAMARLARGGAAAQRQPVVGGGENGASRRVSRVLPRTLQRAAAYAARVPGQRAPIQRGTRVDVLCLRFCERWQPVAPAARRGTLAADNGVNGALCSMKPRPAGSTVQLVAVRRGPTSRSVAARAQDVQHVRPYS
jgi:hypothetical protein